MEIAKIPPERIVLVGQSLGTAVATAVAEHFVQESKVEFAGMVLIAPFSDMATLLLTYTAKGVIPILSPLRSYPALQRFFSGYLRETWHTSSRMENLIRKSMKLNLHLIHSKDDFEIHWKHTESLFYTAANATTPAGMSMKHIDGVKFRRDLGNGGYTESWNAGGLKKISKQIVRYGDFNASTAPNRLRSSVQQCDVTDIGFKQNHRLVSMGGYTYLEEIQFSSTAEMASKVVLITGANTGIVFQIVKSLYSSSQAYHILVGGRSLAKAQDAVGNVTQEVPSSPSKLYPIQIDIEDDDSITRASEDVRSMFGKLDALVNNAGVQLDQQFTAATLTEREMWNQTLNTNITGTQIMTTTFIPLLFESQDPRILFLSSGQSSLAGTENRTVPMNHHPPKGWPKSGFSIPAYRSAKCGMNLLMREWYRMLKEDGAKVWCIAPGFLATSEALKKMGAGDPAVAGPFIRSVLEGQRDDDVGRVVTKDGVQPW
ncbi:MAG: hypothetical protein Q9222_007141 [Ikaeria aurantiellina]